MWGGHGGGVCQVGHYGGVAGAGGVVAGSAPHHSVVAVVVSNDDDIASIVFDNISLCGLHALVG